MTQEERLAALPTDRHIHYWRIRARGVRLWMAFWWDDLGKRHKVHLGTTLPSILPDRPCQHERERQQATAERLRRANALRKVRSNQYRKQREQQTEMAS